MTSLVDNLRSFIMIYQTVNLLKIFFMNRKYHKFFFNQTNSRPSSSTLYEKNKCFVCEKKEFWSFEHIREEQLTFKKKFKNRFEQRFDKTTTQYIFDYKEAKYSIDEDNDEIDQIKVMIIDVNESSSNLSTHDYFEALINSFDSIQNVEMMMIDLNNRAF